MSAGINRQQTPITSHWRLHGHFHYMFGEMHIKVGKKSRAVPLLLPTVEDKSREEWSPRVRHRRQGGERNDKLLLVHLAPWAAVLKFHAKSFQACKWRQNERSKHEQQTGDSSQFFLSLALVKRIASLHKGKTTIVSWIFYTYVFWNIPGAVSWLCLKWN